MSFLQERSNHSRPVRESSRVAVAGRAFTTIVASALTVAVTSAVVASSAMAQVPPPNPDGPKANWALFDQFSTANMRTWCSQHEHHAALDRRNRFALLQLARPFGEHWYLVNALPTSRSRSSITASSPHSSPCFKKHARSMRTR